LLYPFFVLFVWPVCPVTMAIRKKNSSFIFIGITIVDHAKIICENIWVFRSSEHTKSNVLQELNKISLAATFSVLI
jgi:hypothetical protein